MIVSLKRLDSVVIHIPGCKREVTGVVWVGDLRVGDTVVADGGQGKNPLVGGLRQSTIWHDIKRGPSQGLGQLIGIRHDLTLPPVTLRERSPSVLSQHWPLLNNPEYGSCPFWP